MDHLGPKSDGAEDIRGKGTADGDKDSALAPVIRAKTRRPQVRGKEIVVSPAAEDPETAAKIDAFLDQIEGQSFDAKTAAFRELQKQDSRLATAVQVRMRRLNREHTAAANEGVAASATSRANARNVDAVIIDSQAKVAGAIAGKIKKAG